MKKILKTLIIIIVAILLLFIMKEFIRSYDESKGQKQRKESYDRYILNQPTLTTDQARDLVIEKWGACIPESCSDLIVTIEKNNYIWYVTAIYDGLMDDSIAAEKNVASVNYINNQWVLGERIITNKCRPNRGHQDFSAELCI